MRITLQLIFMCKIIIPSLQHLHLNSIEDGWGWKDLESSLFSQKQKHPLRPYFFKSQVDSDNRTLTELYKLALQEGGKLIVYAGGDTATQQNFAKDAFEKRFPGIRLETIVDFSKNHNGRIDYQLETNSLVPDVAQLQTLGDFDRWKRQSVLLPYKPIGWNQVFPQFKDMEGFYTAIYVVAFSNNVNIAKLKEWPTEARDYLRTELKGRIVSTWPNDDDAVLFLYKLFIEKYGWEWLTGFLSNRPLLVRGTQEPFDLVANGSQYLATFSTAGSLRTKQNDTAKFILPRNDPFVSWGQRAAIFKQSKRKNAAKLYMSWWLDPQTQSDVWESWSVRKDIPVPTGFRSIFNYQGQTDPVAFERFVKDRVGVEEFKGKIRIFVGEPEGPSPPGELGSHPDKMGNCIG